MNNLIKFKNPSVENKPIVFCMIDNINTIQDNWAKEIIKNQSDFTLQNLYGKGFEVLQGTNEDNLLKAASKEYKYACVFSTGTEFINGELCFNALIKECNSDFFIKGHILDRKDAYYELHQQCYLINLTTYKNLNYPVVGKQELGSTHKKIKPYRSEENIHNDYTPLWIKQGTEEYEYNHKCHGWNILTAALQNCKIVEAFDNNIRNNKKHLYPENIDDFYNHLSYVFFKERYCSNIFVHKNHTEWFNRFIPNLRQVIAPASGEWYKPMLDPNSQCKVILYDYNPESLKYWKKNVEYLPNVTYEFIQWDLLGNFYDITQHLDLELEDFTLVNLSNIFCYEGTSTLANTKFRLKKENELLIYLKNKIPNAWVNFSARTSTGFIDTDSCIQRIKETPIYTIQDFKSPTWRIQDWY